MNVYRYNLSCPAVPSCSAPPQGPAGAVAAAGVTETPEGTGLAPQDPALGTILVASVAVSAAGPALSGLMLLTVLLRVSLSPAMQPPFTCRCAPTAAGEKPYTHMYAGHVHMWQVGQRGLLWHECTCCCLSVCHLSSTTAAAIPPESRRLKPYQSNQQFY